MRTVNAAGASNVVLVCEHASNRIPEGLGSLGVSPEVLDSHAAWDPGAEAVALLLSQSLDAVLVSAGFSRLVYDLNRPPEHDDAMRAVSEIYTIPGNAALTEADKQARIDAVYNPFHQHLARLLEGFERENRVPVLVTIHTFTPVYLGKTRRVELGILHDSDARLADEMLRVALQNTRLVTLRNQPYGPQDGVTHTLQMQALPRGILNVMIEIRNDLVASAEQQAAVARDLDALLRSALAGLTATASTDRKLPRLARSGGAAFLQ
uniref:N-formylglutamate amidohydrolase n=1 Tax=Pararhizobium sp. IMCC3301 TaxID=3067904 RepID=UPI0027408AF6|nr:N-formylglutamate amidohydrolase [Pararhizobium sp. IMCC3301]